MGQPGPFIACLALRNKSHQKAFIFVEWFSTVAPWEGGAPGLCSGALGPVLDEELGLGSGCGVGRSGWFLCDL